MTDFEFWNVSKCFQNSEYFRLPDLLYKTPSKIDDIKARVLPRGGEWDRKLLSRDIQWLL